MITAVTGGSGFIGSNLIAALRRQGHIVRVLSRRSGSSFSAEIQVVTGDLTSGGCPLGQLLDGCEVVFHCAGEIRNTAAMRLLHVNGTQRLLKAVLREAAFRRRQIHWVQLSSVGAYGPPHEAANAERTVTEDSPSRPCGEYEVTKALSDELLINHAECGLMSYSIVRPSNVLGPDMRNRSLRELAMMVRKGLFFYIGRAGAIAPYVHVDDVVEVLLLCGTDDRSQGKIFNVSNDCLLEELIGGMASALGVRNPRMRLPEGFVRTATSVISKVVPIPLTQERIDALVARTRYPCRKLETELGFTPRLSVPSAIGRVLAK